MAAPATEHVRNIALVGQDGAGKTSLAEAMLHISGKTPRMGTTHDGKSYLDYDEEEIRRRFTLGTSIAPIRQIFWETPLQPCRCAKCACLLLTQ
mgnify:CR=1 FL=1